MTAATICPNCKHQNPDNSIFCNNCGCELNGDIENRIKYFENRIEAAAERAETATYERITKWAKLSTWVISIALTIIGATISVGAYLGFDNILNFKQTIGDAREQVNSSIKDINKARDDAIKDLKKVNVISEQIAEIKKQQNIMEKQLKTTNEYYKDALKLRNGLFDITIQVDKNLTNRNARIKSIVTELNAKGYDIDVGKILDVQVDRTEILFYSQRTKAKADELAKIIAEKLNLKTIRTRFVESSNLNRYNILIKFGSIL